MLRNAGTAIRSVHLPFELLTSTCTNPSFHRFITTAASSSKKAPVAKFAKPSRSSKAREGGLKKSKSLGDPNSKPPLLRLKADAKGLRKRPLLEPHVLSQRLKKLCEGGQLDAAVDMLKTAPQGAQTTPVWNTLIWETLKAQRWNLSYKLYTDMKRRGLSPTTRTYQTMFSGLSRLEHWPTHTVQLTNAHQLYDYFTKHLQAVKYHTPDSEELTVSPLAMYIKILGDAGDFQRIFDVYYAMDPEGPLAPDVTIFTAMFQVLAVRRYADGDEGAVFHNQSSSTAKLLWMQMLKASKKPPGFTIDSHLISVALRALARGRSSDQEFALDIVRDYLGLVQPGETSVDFTNANLTVHTLAATLEVCNEMKKPRHCIYYLQQVMHPRYSSPKAIRLRSQIIDHKHMEQGLRAYVTLAQAGVPGQAAQALETLQWMLRSEITQGNANLRPEPKAFNYVLAACRFSGDWANATKTFELMTGYKAGDFVDVEEGSERGKPEMEMRSKGRNLTPNAEVLSSMVRTALATQLPANIRQALRMVDHFNLNKILGSARVNGKSTAHPNTNNKTAKLYTLYLEKLAVALEEAVGFLMRGRDRDRQDKERSRWRVLEARAKAYLEQRQEGKAASSRTEAGADTDASSRKKRATERQRALY